MPGLTPSTWRGKRPGRGPVWPVLVCAALLLTGCPGSAPDGTDSTSAGAHQAQAVQASAGPDYPPVARDFLLASLQHPTQDGYPPLGPVWQIIAQLDYGGADPARDPLARHVIDMVAAAGNEPVPELAMAWLAVQPQPATEYLAARFAAGDEQYLDALAFRPRIALVIFAKQDPLALSAAGRLYLTRMLVAWRPLTAEYIPLLAKLAGAEEPSVRLQAIGMLVPLGAATEEQRQELWHAGHEEGEELEAAVEGIRLSGDGEFADALVPHAAKARLGEPDESVPRHEALYAAYALTYLPGEQAQLMRGKLLAAADPTIRWAARLGELLNGTPRAWQEAVAAEGVGANGQLVALQPQAVRHADLLPSYALLAADPNVNLRTLAASHLNRYAPYTSYPAAAELAAQLAADPMPEVRAAAWLAIAELGLPDHGAAAAALVPDESERGEVRLAAAAYLMLQADKVDTQEVAP